jgi:NADH-quinone oxidoreductase subunit A
MPPAYIPLLLFSLLVLSFPVLVLAAFRFTRWGSKSGPRKVRPYQSAIAPEGTARGRYSTGFFMIAVVFVVLNVVTIFLVLWAVMFRMWLAAHGAAFALSSMFVFLGILLIGYIWLSKKGALDLV